MSKEQLDYLLAYIDVSVQAVILRSGHLPYYKENDKMVRLRTALYKTVAIPEPEPPTRPIGTNGVKQ